MLLQIVKVPPRDCNGEHFLQAQRLRAQLHPIHILFLAFAPLEFHWYCFGDTSTRREVQFHKVAFPNQATIE